MTTGRGQLICHRIKEGTDQKSLHMQRIIWRLFKGPAILLKPPLFPTTRNSSELMRLPHSRFCSSTDPASTSRLVVSLLLPGCLEAEDWLLLARQKRHMWPMQMTTHAMASNLPTQQYMRRERRRLQAHHIWEKIKPQWTKLRERLHTRYVTNLGWKTRHERLFLNRYGNQQRFWENEYRGYDFEEVKAQWDRTREWFQRSATARFPSQLVISPLLLQFDSTDRGNGLHSRSTTLHRYGVRSRGSTDAKCWQMSVMKSCKDRYRMLCD